MLIQEIRNKHLQHFTFSAFTGAQRIGLMSQSGDFGFRFHLIDHYRSILPQIASKTPIRSILMKAGLLAFTNSVKIDWNSIASYILRCPALLEIGEGLELYDTTHDRFPTVSLIQRNCW